VPSSSSRPPFVSVIIDTYNYGHFIEQAIDSVLAQEFPLERVEILVVDDGSTDDTSQRVKRYGSSIQYFHKPNGGQASALNFGVQKARGEVVALLDADDYWLPQKLKTIVAAFEQHPDVGMIYHRLFETFTETGDTKEAKFEPRSGFLPDHPVDLFWYVVYPTSCLAFRRKYLEQIGPIPGALRVQADAYLAVLLVFLAPVLALSDCLAVYRVHNQNQFYEIGDDMPPARRQKRVDTRTVLIAGFQQWLAVHGSFNARPEVQSFLGRWALYQEDDEFILNPPGRSKYFRHLLLYNKYYRPYMSRRLHLLNYINAFKALLVGYKQRSQ